MLLNKTCDNPPSLIDIGHIQMVLKRSVFSKITYIMDIIQENKHSQLHKHDLTINEFMSDFIDLCDGKFNFGVRLYLN